MGTGAAGRFSNFFSVLSPGTLDYPFYALCYLLAWGCLATTRMLITRGRKCISARWVPKDRDTASIPIVSPMAPWPCAFLFGVGVKYNVTEKVNVGFESGIYRFYQHRLYRRCKQDLRRPLYISQAARWFGLPWAEIMNETAAVKTGSDKIGFYKRYWSPAGVLPSKKDGLCNG